MTAPRSSGPPDQEPVSRTQGLGRPAIGVALGGGSAKGIAHVGVIRWLEEHRIPIDLVAGTSMGGLIGGSFATGMDADELDALLTSTDWDALFGTAKFQFKNIRRKTDGRDFPSRLEFGLKGGIVPPTGLNSGEQVDLLLDRITAPYSDIGSFDDLPTPFRAVATDLVTATQVVLDHGSLAGAMRATMSLPLIFPAVEMDGRLLVDGGAINNVPANVARAMGAQKVVAVNVGDLSDPEEIAYTLLGLAGATLDAMMRASTKEGIAAADIIINVPLKDYGSLDWRRSAELIQRGYDAAEGMSDQLLPLAVSEAEYSQWQQERRSRRLQILPVPAFVSIEGFARSDTRRLEVLLSRHVGVPFHVEELEKDLTEMTGLDRYETITWRFVKNRVGDAGIMVMARSKPYAPPFMMLGFNLENTTSTDFRISVAGRYLSYGTLTSGSELRIDGAIGSYPAAGIELYEPFPSTPLFVAPYARVVTDAAQSLGRDLVVAKYGLTTYRMGVNAGINLGLRSDLRVGGYYGHVDADLEIGDPRLPELRGSESGVEAVWRYDGQDSPVIPSGGTVATTRWLRVLDGPDGLLNGMTFPLNNRIHQLSATGSRFWSVSRRNRVFVYGGFGTSFNRTADPTYKFVLGSPLRLGAYRSGELRASNYYLVTGGYLRQLGRLPDFLGGPIFAGAWLENGDAVEDFDDAIWRINTTGAGIVDTIFGPVMLAASADFDGRWRTYIGVGRIFQ